MGFLLYPALCVLLSSLTSAGAPHYAPARFASHVSVHTPAHSFSHGVGDTLATSHARHIRGRGRAASRHAKVLAGGLNNPFGYPKVRPHVPFYREDIPHENSLVPPQWNNANLLNVGTIPVLPASPYHVNSPNPESLWPEGLFIPPSVPLRGFLHPHGLTDKSDHLDQSSENAVIDKFLLSEDEALQALEHIRRHGELFFDDIPHEQSLQEHQRLREANGLAPHRLGSTRHLWPAFRP